MKNSDLILSVGTNVDRNIWDEGIYYKLVDAICGNREYQKDAIFTALRFMCSGQYENLEQLARQNFDNNEKLREYYSTNFNHFKKALHFPAKLSASLDLATGTGKSYVLYALAVIMLASKRVDQVLVVVPSVTIEIELTNKFKDLASNSDLLSLLMGVGMTSPRIINGSESIVEGCICIENRDAVYKNARSSISDSLKGKGERTLVLNDEVHHVYNSTSNEWKKFLNDDYENDISFKYIIGVSGTCYSGNSGNEYFSDVIYCYSLKASIEAQFVKNIQYIAEAELPTGSDDKWQVMINSHNDIARKLPKELEILPISIVVTEKVANCKKIATEFKEKLKKINSLSNEGVNEKVLIVHSQADAATDRLRLKDVDKQGNKVEWIFSVSMLTEGWDVKRVFQIVPHEDRAFNSKLLIAQVIGRGLRVPENWKIHEWGQPKALIFNHEKWSDHVRELMDEILEFEKKITTKIIPESEHNFNLTNVSFISKPNVIETEKSDPYNWLSKGYVDFGLHTVTTEHNASAQIVDIVGSATTRWKTKYTSDTFTIQEIAEAMFSKFLALPEEIQTEGAAAGKSLTEYYQELWPVPKLKKMIKLSLKKSGNTEITKELRNGFLSSMGTLFRTSNKSITYDIEPKEFFEVDTTTMRNVSVNASSLRNKSGLFYNSETISTILPEESEFFGEVIAVDTLNPSGYRSALVPNSFDFKTPQNAVIADSRPEIQFIQELTKPEIANHIDKWVKSASTGFYSIEFTWRKGEHPKNSSFNPDFFLVVGNRIIVAEVKDNPEVAEPSAENKGKWKAAKKHFEHINQHVATGCKEHGELDIEGLQYKFTMVTPNSYDAFFGTMTSGDVGRIDNFRSKLDDAIEGWR
ncbi:MAG: DEAD/DEAH box helicase family protein [Candidatus Ancillula sp.]|nr:DEAD/DEAH box helicase family protein [Candidatus Ancillula sp.]